MSARDITRVLLVFVALASCAVSTHAQARDELDLSWPAISGCPKRGDTLKRIEDQLGRPLGQVPDDALRADVEIRRSALGYTLTLQTTHAGARGERTFQAARCSEVRDAAVLVIALSLGEAEAARVEARSPAPERRAKAQQAAKAKPKPKPQAEPETEPASEPEAPTPAEPTVAAPRAARRSHFNARAGATVEGGFLPGAGIGTEVALGFDIERSHGEVAGLWLAPKSSEPRFDGSAVEVTLWTARVGYCHDLTGTRNRLGACGGVEIGQAFGRGIELAPSVVRNFIWSAGWVSMRLTSQLLPHFGFVLEPAIAVPFTQHRFVSTTPTQNRSAVLHTPRPTSKRITLGVAFFF